VKKFLPLVFALLLTGCGTKYPATANLKLQLGQQPAGLYSEKTTAVLKGHDARVGSAVVIYHIDGEPEVRIPNQTEPHILITERLANGLLQQGLLFESGAPVRIQLDLDELLVSVTRPKLLYNARARSHLTLTTKNQEISLTKTYDREANRESATRPPVADLEKMLNGQLTEIVAEILQDKEVRAAIDKK